LTFSTAVLVTPLQKAEMVADVENTTTLVLIVNVALVEPAGMVTLPGTVATDVSLLDSDTAAPPAGAGPFRVTVPTEELPPVTVDGFSVSETSTGGITVSDAVRGAPPP
jgi:hypothetical protein